ncbi:nucleic acid/nucleotide deaminase domain-containing protein [Aspergillus affinis]|uniref:nucleic acid/nucleotide deaminase domain-containing protein n=1 Tax=Aspergillus affinis TaxID=1070780 RepID=UPI0022FE5CC7|nr:uncharacterized protein KD926_000442 [Aspergillus affinis]KAI9044531.1 hypothetical protein KD926_000442 [Aspergillus affinis]
MATILEIKVSRAIRTPLNVVKLYHTIMTNNLHYSKANPFICLNFSLEEGKDTFCVSLDNSSSEIRQNKLQETVDVFKRICQAAQGSKSVTIYPIPYDKASERPIERPLNLEQTLELLGKRLDPSTIAKVTGENCLVSKTQEKLKSLQRQVPWVHAEMQMVLYFSTHGRSLSDLFPYLRCNQLSYFICTSFLKHYKYSQIPTRGCDGALLQPWSVPEVTGVTSMGAHSIPRALRCLEDYLMEILKGMLNKVSTPFDAQVRNQTTSMDESCHGLLGLSDLRNTELPTEEAKVMEAFERELHWLRVKLSSPDQANMQKQAEDLLPSEKLECFDLLASICHMDRLHPTEDVWYDFGFFVCRNELEETMLANLYSRLLVSNKFFNTLVSNDMRSGPKPDTATFSEFWQAYQSCKLIQLMDSKGLASERKMLPCLEAFLSVPRRYSQSIWLLKQFIAIDKPAESPPCREVEDDYGFKNCQSIAETRILMEIYKKLLLKADPLEIHDACHRGRLFEFAQCFDIIDERNRKLMENRYTLWEEDDYDYYQDYDRGYSD